MKKRIWQAVVCCSFVLSGLSIGPVEAQDSWSDWAAQWFGTQVGEVGAQGSEEAASNVTPSHVFQATRDLLAEIEILREAMAVADYPGESEPQEGRAPVHVYARTLEVLEKVARTQRRLGIEVVNPGFIPVKAIVPADVLGQVQNIIGEIRKIKSQLVIEESIEPAPYENGKTPSLVYKNLGDASLLLNGLVGRPITPNDVFERLEYVYDDMELVAANLQVSLNRELPAVNGRKSPKDVARLILRASYKIIDLQNRLGMDASNVPQLAIVRVTPAENFEVTNILLAEMNRIKVHMNIDLPHETRPASRNKRPTDVFVQLVRILRNLDILVEAADQAA